jgi:hypothetical protein
MRRVDLFSDAGKSVAEEIKHRLSPIHECCESFWEVMPNQKEYKTKQKEI